MSDRYRARWEQRQAKWEARRAKWEARAAWHEARRVRHEARRAEWEARKGAGRGQEPPDKVAMQTMGAFGALFLLLGLVLILLYPGVWAIASLVACILPGASMLIPWMIWARNNAGVSASAANPADTAATQQASPPAATPAALDLAATPSAQPDRAQAPSGRAPDPEPPRPSASEQPPDPSYYRERAAGYRRRIQSIIRNRRPGPLADVMASAVANLEQWEERVGRLADRLTTFERDTLIQRDIKEVPANIARLRGQIETETDAVIQQQMTRTLAGYESQQAMLDTLARLMRRTRLMLDDTLVAMGTIYSQIQVIDAMDIDSAQANRIAAELDEQVKRLNDLLATLGEVNPDVSQPAEFFDPPKRVQMSRSGAAEA